MLNLRQVKNFVILGETFARKIIMNYVTCCHFMAKNIYTAIHTYEINFFQLVINILDITFSFPCGN